MMWMKKENMERQNKGTFLSHTTHFAKFVIGLGTLEEVQNFLKSIYNLNFGVKGLFHPEWFLNRFIKDHIKI